MFQSFFIYFYNFFLELNIFEDTGVDFGIIEKKPIITLDGKSLTTSSKCLDLNYLELFLWILFISKYFTIRLKKIFDVISSERGVTLG